MRVAHYESKLRMWILADNADRRRAERAALVIQRQWRWYVATRQMVLSEAQSKVRNMLLRLVAPNLFTEGSNSQDPAVKTIIEAISGRI